MKVNPKRMLRDVFFAAAAFCLPLAASLIVFGAEITELLFAGIFGTTALGIRIGYR